MDKGKDTSSRSDTGRGGRATARSSRGRGHTASTPSTGTRSLPQPPLGHIFQPPLQRTASQLRSDITHAPLIRPSPVQSRTAPLMGDTSTPSSSSRTSLSPLTSDNEQEH